MQPTLLLPLPALPSQAEEAAALAAEELLLEEENEKERAASKAEKRARQRARRREREEEERRQVRRDLTPGPAAGTAPSLAGRLLLVGVCWWAGVNREGALGGLLIWGRGPWGARGHTVSSL
jgi:hypothetical protein